jgi:hypothetical protein
LNSCSGVSLAGSQTFEKMYSKAWAVRANLLPPPSHSEGQKLFFPLGDDGYGDADDLKMVRTYLEPRTEFEFIGEVSRLRAAAKRLVMSQQTKIAIIAAALLKSGTLTGDEIIALAESEGPWAPRSIFDKRRSSLRRSLASCPAQTMSHSRRSSLSLASAFHSGSMLRRICGQRLDGSSPPPRHSGIRWSIS